MRVKRIGQKRKRKVRICAAVLLILALGLSLGACNEEKKSDKRAIDFTVIPEDLIPEQLGQAIEEMKSDPFITSYGDKENLYIAVGYGLMPTTGYCIQVMELYETKDYIYIDTDFLGPGIDEDVAKHPSYPYIVVKAEYSDKMVKQVEE